MSDFLLFQQAVERYEQQRTFIQKDEPNDSLVSPCIHVNEIMTDKGVIVCTDCGEEIDRKLSHSKEWNYYGSTDKKQISEPNRVRARKKEERSIFKDVENLNFSESIVAKANTLYSEVTKDKIFRGEFRKSIVFACIFHAFKLSGKPLSHDKLINIFNIDKKTGLRGIKFVSLNEPKTFDIKTTHITPLILVEEIMDQFDATEKQKNEVKVLYQKIKNKSSKLNRSRPQSVAAGLTYYWICQNEKDISLKNFAKNVKLSELTIDRIAKEITRVLEL